MALKTALGLLLLAFSLDARAESFGAISFNGWQETIILKNASGQEFSLAANTQGPCLGLGYGRRYGNWGLSGLACAFMARSDIGSETPALQYRERSVDTVGGMLGPSVHYYPAGGRVAVGVLVPAFFAYSDWDLPDPSYTIVSRTRFSAALLADTNYRFGRVVFHQRFGSVIGVGWLWSLGLDYLL